MRGGNFEIEIKKVDKKLGVPDLPFLCTHNQRGTYCGKGLVIRDTPSNGDRFTLVDLGDKICGGEYNTVFSRDTLENLISIGGIVPREGKVIIYE